MTETEHPFAKGITTSWGCPVATAVRAPFVGLEPSGMQQWQAL